MSTRQEDPQTADAAGTDSGEDTGADPGSDRGAGAAGHVRLKQAAAIAGMLFSILLIAVFWLLRSSVPADPQEPGAWLGTSARTVALALNLVPFAGIAFLWFIGVLRDRLGQREDRFFATVFLAVASCFWACCSLPQLW